MEALLLVLDGVAMILVVLWCSRAAARPGEPPAGLFAWRDPVAPAERARAGRLSAGRLSAVRPGMRRTRVR